MRRWLLIGGAALVLLVLLALGVVGWEVQRSQRADLGWRPQLAAPSFAADGPRVLIDEGHHNASTAGIGGRYFPFARLLRADGFRVARGRGAFTPSALAGAEVLVIANASGAAKPQLFGINLPGGGKGDRGAPAFTAAEIEALREWVEGGGGLLLVADHAPFGAAARALGEAFGVTMHAGFTEVPDEVSDPLAFSRENGRLGEHAILEGGAIGARVERMATYTGQSLDGPPAASVLLRLPANAVEYIPAEPEFIEQPAGGAQGLAMEVGAGRVVVLGEAAMLTAQVYRGEHFGLNAPGNDNQQFALNVMHWLAERR